MKYKLSIILILFNLTIVAQIIKTDSLFTLLQVNENIVVKRDKVNKIKCKSVLLKGKDNIKYQYLIEDGNVIFAKQEDKPLNIWELSYNHLKRNKQYVGTIKEDYYAYLIDIWYYGGSVDIPKNELEVSYVLINDSNYFFIKEYDESINDTIFYFNKYKQRNTNIYFFSRFDNKYVKLIGGYCIENKSDMSFFREKLIMPTETIVFAEVYNKMILSVENNNEELISYEYTNEAATEEIEITKSYLERFETIKKVFKFSKGLNLVK